MSVVLLIGSIDPYSGKAAAILGFASHLQQQGVRVAYGKPLEIEDESRGIQDLDLAFMTEVLQLSPEAIAPTLLQLDSETMIHQMTHPQLEKDYLQPLKDYIQQSNADVILLEGPDDLNEGRFFDLSLSDMAEQLTAHVVLICHYQSALVIESLLEAKARLGPQLMGVVINEVPEADLSTVNTVIKPYLETQSIPILGVLAFDPILRSIRVGELVRQLDAEVLCCPDRMDLMVEDFAIGAMNVNSALKYFRKSNHKAVITGGDRTDIQLAALETSTLCLILTGRLPLDPRIQNRAEELEVPVLSVDLDTFTTSERIEQMFGQISLHDTVKIRFIQDLMSKNVDFSRLWTSLGLAQPLVSAAKS